MIVQSRLSLRIRTESDILRKAAELFRRNPSAVAGEIFFHIESEFPRRQLAYQFRMEVHLAMFIFSGKELESAQ